MVKAIKLAAQLLDEAAGRTPAFFDYGDNDDEKFHLSDTLDGDEPPVSP